MYAESLGSIPAVFLTRIKDIEIGGIIVSGAEYMNYGIFNGLAIKLFAPMTYKLMTKIVNTGDVKFPAFLKIKMGITDDVFAPMLKQACQNLTLETTKATFWEAVKLYPEHMSKWEPNPDVRISCWYGEKEMNMKKAIKHLKRAFPNLEVHPFKGLGHGEIMAHTELGTESIHGTVIALDKLSRSLIFKGFRKMLNAEFGEAKASQIWKEANGYLLELERKHPDITGDNKMMILPAAALYLALRDHAPEQALPLLQSYGTKMGNKIAGVVHAVTSIPGVSIQADVEESTETHAEFQQSGKRLHPQNRQ